MSEAATPERSGGLSPGVVAWLVAGAVAAFAAFVAVLAYQPDIAARADPGAHALSRSPVGYAGVIELLRADGAVVTLNRRRDPGARLAANALIVMTPRMETSLSTITRLGRDRHVLIVPPKWLTTPNIATPGRVAAIGVVPQLRALSQALALAAPRSGAPGKTLLNVQTDQNPMSVRFVGAEGTPLAGATWLGRPPVAKLRTITGSIFLPIVVDGRDRLLLAQLRGTSAYVLSDPDLIDNKGIADLAGARAAASMLETLADGGPIVFDLTLTGLGGRNPLKLAFEPPFVAATASFALAAALLGLSARARFGPVRVAARAYGFGKRALADSAASLLAVAGREPRLAPRYAEIARAAARAAAGLPEDMSDDLEIVALDRIGTARGAGTWSELATQAKAVRTRAQLMALARSAHAWRTEMTHGRG